MRARNCMWRRGAAFVAVTVAATLVVAPTAQAQTDESCRADGGFTINYLNGVSNTWTAAFESRAELAESFGGTHQGEPVTYNNLYNDTHGQVEDVVEVFDQKVREAVEQGVLTQEMVSRLTSRIIGTGISIGTAPGRGFAWLLSQVPIDVIREAGEGMGDFLSALPGWYEAAHNSVNSWMTDQVRRFADWSLLDAETRQIIDNHSSTVRSQIASGRKPLIVSHSQGNLFANPIAQQVRDATGSNALGVAHVATPASLRSGDYVTIDTDLIIAPLFSGTGMAPPPNVSMRPLLAGSNHGFADAYLRPGEASRAAVLGMVGSALDQIVLPAGTGSDGLFTMTLTWSGPGDVDLHTFEPNGQHVYYGASTGSLGFLDVDNTSGFGPEHYYAACSAAAVGGSFLVGVTNYAAPAGTTATVQLSSSSFIGEPVALDVGSATRSSSMTYQLFRVEVTRGGDGRLQVSQTPA